MTKVGLWLAWSQRLPSHVHNRRKHWQNKKAFITYYKENKLKPYIMSLLIS